MSALIFSKDGKLFQGRKDKGGVYADCWHIPGGGIEDTEDKITALTREVQEETGIDIAPYSIELIDDTGTGQSEKTLKDTNETVLVEMHFFVYKIIINDKTADEIEVDLKDDLIAYQWTDSKDLQNIKLTPPSITLFKKLGYI